MIIDTKVYDMRSTGEKLASTGLKAGRVIKAAAKGTVSTIATTAVNELTCIGGAIIYPAIGIAEGMVDTYNKCKEAANA